MYRGLMILRWLAPEGDQPQGGQQPKAGEGGSDQPQGVTLEQVNEIVNKAITARNKQVEAKIDKSFADFSSKFDALATKLATVPSEPKDAPKGDDLANNPFVKGLQKQLEDQKKATEKILQERDAEKATARDSKLRSKLTDNLTKGGIDPRHVGKAVGILVDVEKRVRFAADDGDDLVFHDASGDVDLETGLKGWLKTDDAKIFLPPRGTQGAGDRSAGRPQGSPNGPEQISAGKALLSMVTAMPGSGIPTT